MSDHVDPLSSFVESAKRTIYNGLLKNFILRKFRQGGELGFSILDGWMVLVVVAESAFLCIKINKLIMLLNCRLSPCFLITQSLKDRIII